MDIQESTELCDAYFLEASEFQDVASFVITFVIRYHFYVKAIRWSQDKNLELMRSRRIAFDRLLKSKFVGIEAHPTKTASALYGLRV